MKIPFFDYPRVYKDEKEDLLKIIDQTCSRGAFIMQKDLEEFEASLSNYTNSKYAMGVANGTDGLEIAIKSLGVREGDEIIISSHTMIATASAIKMSGGIPVPIEIGSDNLIEANAIESAINSRTVGIMPTQLNGRTCEMDKIQSIVDKYKLFLIEDAAQALGSKFKNKSAGTFGHASAISFFPAKVLGCLGDGGAILTQDPEIFDKVWQIHDHGRNHEGEVCSWGRNSRLDNLQAAILNHRLKSYKNVIKRRREIASLYDSKLCHLDEIKLPPPPSEKSDHFDVFQNYEIEAESRDDLKDFLYQKGVGTLIQWGGKGIHQWDNLGFNMSLPNTELFFSKCLMIPMNIFLTDKEVDYICEIINNFYRK